MEFVQLLEEFLHMARQKTTDCELLEKIVSSDRPLLEPMVAFMEFLHIHSSFAKRFSYNNMYNFLSLLFWTFYEQHYSSKEEFDDELFMIYFLLKNNLLYKNFQSKKQSRRIYDFFFSNKRNARTSSLPH